MAELKDILYKVSLKTVSGTTDIPVEQVCFDSRMAGKNSLFVAVKGTQVDGHDFIDKAIEKGARTIVLETMPDELKSNVVYAQVDNSARALGVIAANFYGNPSGKLNVVAVTGTNGKTTIVTLLHQLFRKLGYNAGLLSTVINKINETPEPATHTTPDAIQINELLSKMVNAGCTHCFMEASSHAIEQERVAGLKFAGAIFTNISRDHLDYHHTFRDYITAKKKLFDELPSAAFALVNADDKRGAVMVQNTRADKKTYGMKSMSDFKGKILSNTLQGLELDIDQQTGWFTLVGDFNAYNLLAVYASAILLGENQLEVLTELSALPGAPGRFELTPTDSGVTGIVDYAHTPDALENVLTTIEKLRTGNETLITVVGCGGDRDRGKRPMMAAIACKYSDKVILTSDNPRSEDPAAILADMRKGVKASAAKKVLEIIDRREAIKTACSLVRKGDVILVAGKGHETYQEIKGVRYPFDDRQALIEMLNLMFN